MHIVFYGYGSHAKRIKNLCIQYMNKNSKINFSGIKRKFQKSDIDIFHNLDDAIRKYGKIDCIFITSTNATHLDLFKNCIEKKIQYIYVEKPALGIEEFCLKNSKKFLKSIHYIQVGYHYNYTKAIKKLKEIISKKIYGDLIRIDMFSGHGIAYNENFPNSWRAQEKYALLETVLSHFINLSTDLNIENDLTYFSKKNELNSLKDTDHIILQNKKGALITLTCSWGTPLEQSIKAYFSDGIWEYDFDKIILKYPRNTFDDLGLFKKPKKRYEYCEFEGINKSIFYFLEKVKNNKSHKFEFNNSLMTHQLIEKIKTLQNK